MFAVQESFSIVQLHPVAQVVFIISCAAVAIALFYFVTKANS